MLSAVAHRYAKALVEVAAAPGSASNPAAILSQLKAVDKPSRIRRSCASALLSPAVSPSRKRAIVTRVLGPLGLDNQARNFLFVSLTIARG